MSVTTASVLVDWEVHERHQFCNRLSSLGQAHPVVTPEAIAAVEAIVKENRRVTVNEIAAYLDMSHGSAHHIVRGKKLKNYI